MEKHTIEIPDTGAGYLVPSFIAALDELYCLFEQHTVPEYDGCLVDALRMYASHKADGRTTQF